MPTVRNLAAAALAAFVVAAPLQAEPEARALPASVTVLTRADFANKEWFSVADVLDHAPSINVFRTASRGSSATARLRGLSGPGSLVIALDGRPLTHEYDGAVDLSQIPLNLIERIEITRGGANVLYGPATAGIVNIVTARPERRGFTTDLGTGIGRRGVRSHNGRFASRTNVGDATYTGGLEDSGGFTRNDESEFTSHFGNFTRPFRQGGYWGAEYLYTDADTGTPDGTPAPFETWNGHEEKIPINADGREKRQFQMARLVGASPQIASGTVRAELTYGVREYDRFAAAGHLTDLDNTSADARLIYSRKGLDIGGEYAALSRKDEGTPREEADRSAALITQRFDAGQWTFVPGMRWDVHSRAGDAPTLRAAVLFQPTATWTGSLTAQRAPRFATFDEIFVTSATRLSLDPEKSDSIDAGLAWNASHFRTAVTYFTSATRDVIASGSSGTLENGARERARGVEVEAAGRIGRGVWSEVNLQASWSYQDVKRRDIGADSYRRAPLAPRQTAFVSADLRMPWKTSLTNEVRYEGAQFSATGGLGTKLPPFALWNTRFNIRIHAADLYFAVENMLRRPYSEAFGTGGTLAPQPARTFWTGLTIRFLD